MPSDAVSDSTGAESRVLGCDDLRLRIHVLDPLAELETPREELYLSSRSAATVNICCPECRRPCALDFRFKETANDHLTIRIRNVHDTSANWVAPRHTDAAVPAQGHDSRACFKCPHCARDIAVALRRIARSRDDAGDNLALDTKKGCFAYVTLLYGSAVDYVVGALVLGWTLAKPVLEPERTACYRRVLLHTDDVPLEYLHLLSIFWELRRVDYLTGSTAMYHDYGGSRFKEVFTKLQVLNQVEFDKVLMLDNDLIVRRNIDSLFNLRAPAALKRPGGRDQPEHGACFHASVFWQWRRLEKGDKPRGSDVQDWRYDMMSGINAGVMLLRPDRIVYERMLSEIRDNGHPEHLDCYGPEQEYLGRFYSAFGPGWIHMDARFNYQPLLGRGANRFMRNLDALQEVAVAHFSGPRVKPWAGLVAQHAKLGPESLRRLMSEDSKAFRVRFPENPRLPATGAERYGEKGFPTLIVSLVREWAEQLRRVAQNLSEHHGIELIAAVEAVRSQEQRLSRKLSRAVRCAWRLAHRGPSLIAVMGLFLILMRRGLAARSLPRKVVAFAVGWMWGPGLIRFFLDRKLHHSRSSALAVFKQT